jgi:hypothetical protein
MKLVPRPKPAAGVGLTGAATKRTRSDLAAPLFLSGKEALLHLRPLLAEDKRYVFERASATLAAPLPGSILCLKQTHPTSAKEDE